jgi:RNA polymerase sigma-70 factor (ECF subfamily)
VTNTPAALTDRELADAVVSGGAEWAFRELYRRHSPRLFQLVLRLVGGARPDAEDIVQDAWINAVGALPRFRWEAAFETWLTGIAINQARSFWRRKGTRLFDPIADDAVVAKAVAVGDKLDLDAAIARLPHGYRAVLVLHDVEGLTHEEIGARLGIAAGTSKSQLFAARRAMRAHLSPKDDASEIEGERRCEPILKTT